MKISSFVKRIGRRIISLTSDKISVNVVDVTFPHILNDKIILITGASGGLGMAFANSFLKSGGRVILSGRNIEKLKCSRLELERKDNTYTDKIAIIEIDQNDIDSFSTKFDECIKIWGRIDVLVNNAGIMGATIPNADKNTFDRVISTNLRGTFFMSQITIKYFRDNNIKGNILNISSSSSLRPAYSAYSLSKWSIRGLTLGLAKLGCEYGITVNAIAPGPTATRMLSKNDCNEMTLPHSPIGRFVSPSEIANMATILISEAGRSIVGDTIFMSGGAALVTFDDDDVNF